MKKVFIYFFSGLMVLALVAFVFIFVKGDPISNSLVNNLVQSNNDPVVLQVPKGQEPLPVVNVETEKKIVPPSNAEIPTTQTKYSTPTIVHEVLSFEDNSRETTETVTTLNEVYYYSDQPDFRIVCEQPCPIKDDILRAKLIGAREAVKRLIDLVGIDVLPSRKPVNVYLTSSEKCGKYDPSKYNYRFAGSSYNGLNNHGSYMCLWEYDDPNLILPLTKENALRIHQQMVLVHEYGHILFYGRAYVSPEDFVKAFSFLVSGNWKGNGVTDADFRPVTDTCDVTMNQYGKGVYNLCQKCGFQTADIKTVMTRLDSEFQKLKAVEPNRALTKEQFKQIIDDVTGKDAVTDCGVDWLKPTEDNVTIK